MSSVSSKGSQSSGSSKSGGVSDGSLVPERGSARVEIIPRVADRAAEELGKKVVFRPKIMLISRSPKVHDASLHYQSCTLGKRFIQVLTLRCALRHTGRRQ